MAINSNGFGGQGGDADEWLGQIGTLPYNNGNVPSALSKAKRGPISSLFNAGKVSAEDFARDLYKQSQQNAFNKEMTENQYQMAVSSMRNAGLNPILAFGTGTQNGIHGSSTSTAGGQGGTDMGSILSFVAQIGQIFAGLYTKGNMAKAVKSQPKQIYKINISK